MRSCPRAERWASRAQVWLGTLVEVALPMSSGADENFAAAFGAIAHVHRCMSPLDPASDLARIAREAHLRAVEVDAATYAVLEVALRLAAETGLFDPTAADDHSGDGAPAGLSTDRGDDADIGALRLDGSNRVRASTPIKLDLGGVAKGYAVDCAVEVLQRRGAPAGTVNAGGDLRVFGPDAWQLIRVRNPEFPSLSVPLVELRDSAVATTGDYFCQGRSNIVDSRSRSAHPVNGSITVVAPTCAMADALTKVVALDPAGAVSVLARHWAHAFRFEHSRAGLQCLTNWAGEGAHLRSPSTQVA